MFRIHKKANPYVKRILQSACNFLSENKTTAYIFLATTPMFWATKSKQVSHTFHFAVKGISSIISRGFGVCFLKILLCTFNAVINPLYRILLKNNNKKTSRTSFASRIDSNLFHCFQTLNSYFNSRIIISFTAF